MMTLPNTNGIYMCGEKYLTICRPIGISTEYWRVTNRRTHTYMYVPSRAMHTRRAVKNDTSQYTFNIIYNNVFSSSLQQTSYRLIVCKRINFHKKCAMSHIKLYSYQCTTGILLILSQPRLIEQIRTCLLML